MARKMSKQELAERHLGHFKRMLSKDPTNKYFRGQVNKTEKVLKSLK